MENYMTENEKGNVEVPNNESLVTGMTSDEDDEMWKCDEEESDDDIIGNCIKVYSPNSDVFNKNNLVKLTERKVLEAVRKTSNSSSDTFKTISDDKEKINKDSNFVAVEKNQLQDSNASIGNDMDIDEDNLNDDTLETVFRKIAIKEVKKQKLIDQELKKKRYPQDDEKPNCKKVKPSSSTDLSLNALDEDSILLNEVNPEYLATFYDKIFSEDTEALVEMYHENIEVSPLEECILIKELSKRMGLDSTDEDSETENSESFIDDPDIVNPEILYNIDLNEYYMQMDILVQKISETPDDQTVLAECIRLPPIPENEHGTITYTEEERLYFSLGISEYEYDIDTDNWNKIMVKRAVVFAAHAGFTIANEESLYVLADVAIDYIKKLAVIMKNNFDIQASSSYPDCIDPINNSLLQIGVKDGIAELIKHYENDVFGRRDKLIKKCQHLRKIVDQYIERMLPLDTKNQKSSNEDIVLENPISEKVMKKEEIKLKEDKSEIETVVEEVQTDISSTIEEIEIETQSTSVENMLVDIKIDQTEPVCTDDTDCEMKLETNENIRIEPVDGCDINIEYTRPVDTEKIDIDISEHSKPVHTFVKPVHENNFKKLRGNNDFPLPKLSDGFQSSSITKKKKLLDFATLKKWLEQFYPPEGESESEPDPVEDAKKIRKRLREHSKEFSILLKSYASYNNSISTESDKLAPPKTVLVNQVNDENEASSLNTNNTIQDISTPVVENKNDNCDLNNLHHISIASSSSSSNDFVHNSPNSSN